MHCPFCRHLDSRVLDSRSPAFGRAQLPAREVELTVLGPLRDLDEVAYLALPRYTAALRPWVISRLRSGDYAPSVSPPPTKTSHHSRRISDEV
jgi:transcriptional regulator NrdR family protein